MGTPSHSVACKECDPTDFVLIVVTLCCQLVSAYTTDLPIWVTSPLFRAGHNAVISSFTGSGTNPQYIFTFSSPLSGVPNLAYGIKGYRGTTFLTQPTIS